MDDSPAAAAVPRAALVCSYDLALTDVELTVLLVTENEAHGGWLGTAWRSVRVGHNSSTRRRLPPPTVLPPVVYHCPVV